MYQCQQCSTAVSSKTPSYLLTVQQRKKQYPVRPKVNIHRKEGKTKVTDDPGGTGFEVTKEIVVCHSCYTRRE